MKLPEVASAPALVPVHDTSAGAPCVKALPDSGTTATAVIRRSASDGSLITVGVLDARRLFASREGAPSLTCASESTRTDTCAVPTSASGMSTDSL